MSLASELVKSVDWSSYELLSGQPTQFGAQLAEFVAPEHERDRRKLWDLMENSVFAQDDISSAAEPAISVLLASLTEVLPVPVQISVLDLLFHLIHAAAFRSDELGKRCMESAASGAWLLVRVAVDGPSSVTDACLEVLDISAPQCAQALRRASIG